MGITSIVEEILFLNPNKKNALETLSKLIKGNSNPLEAWKIIISATKFAMLKNDKEILNTLLEIKKASEIIDQYLLVDSDEKSIKKFKEFIHPFGIDKIVSVEIGDDYYRTSGNKSTFAHFLREVKTEKNPTNRILTRKEIALNFSPMKMSEEKNESKELKYFWYFPIDEITKYSENENYITYSAWLHHDFDLAFSIGGRDLNPNPKKNKYPYHIKIKK